MTLLLPALQSPTGPAASREAIRFGDLSLPDDGLSLTYGELAAASAALAARIADAGRVAVWATPTAATVIAVVASLRAGVPVVPLNPVPANASWRTSWPTASPRPYWRARTTSCRRRWRSCGG